MQTAVKELVIQNPGQPWYGTLMLKLDTRNLLSTIYYGSKTFWIGDDPNDAVTDSAEQLYQMWNAFLRRSSDLPTGRLGQ